MEWALVVFSCWLFLISDLIAAETKQLRPGCWTETLVQRMAALAPVGPTGGGLCPSYI
jgi:hypothetical protein